MKKPKILILKIEEHLHETMLNGELKELGETYEVVLASSIVDAFDKIAKAKLIENDPIRAIIFQRKTLVASEEKCRVVAQFAEYYYDKHLVAINMLSNDQDSEARDWAVSANYCKSNNWEYLQLILDTNIK